MTLIVVCAPIPADIQIVSRYTNGFSYSAQITRISFLGHLYPVIVSNNSLGLVLFISNSVYSQLYRVRVDGVTVRMRPTL